MTLKIEISFAWWWPLYKNSLVLLCDLTGMEPDAQKFEYWARKAMKARAILTDSSEI